MIDKTVNELGGLNFIYSQAGYSVGILSEEHKLENVDFDSKIFSAYFNVNYYAHVALTKYAMPHLEKTKGSIIYTVAPLCKKATSGSSIYSSTQGALVQFARCIALEAAKKGVRINMMIPGLTQSESYDEIIKQGMTPEQERAYINTMNPINRVAQPEEMAKLIAFLASDDNLYMTGVQIINDGGQYLTNSFQAVQQT